ncbi:MAG: hypothetical protein WD060_10045 [Pirellulales bacterium]
MKRSASGRILLLTFLCVGAAQGVEGENLNSLPADLVVPETVRGEPAAGTRVAAVTRGWEETDVRHVLYRPPGWLPPGWRPGRSYPVIVEYPGNGGYRNDLGDVEETKRYCIATVEDMCQRFGGDRCSVVLCGFSRGAIAGNSIGLHDDAIASLWCGFFCHSHYDGVHEWPYPGSDPASALRRLGRLAARPQWISHELDVSQTRDFIHRSGVDGPFTFVPIPYPNHSAAWVLRDIPERGRARKWCAAWSTDRRSRRPGQRSDLDTVRFRVSDPRL